MKRQRARSTIPFPVVIRLAFLCVLLSLPFVASAAPLTRQTVRRHLPRAATTARPIGQMPGGTRLTLAIDLPLRNQPALQLLLRQLYDPASTNYHHYLTPEQFAGRFGPTEADYRVVKAFAIAHGLTVPRETPNRMLVAVNGTVADIERTFHTTLRLYQHPTEPRTFYAPDVDPSFDLGVPVLRISGLDNYSLPHPNFHLVPAGKSQTAKPNAGSGPDGSYAGYDFRDAYAPDTTLTGSGQTMGLLQFDGYSTNDINYYETQAGLPSVTLSNVLLDGASGLPTGGDNDIEVALDIEMAVSMAPGLSEIIVYESPLSDPFEIILNQMAEDDLAEQLSSSWYEQNGTSNAVADQIFQQMDAQGQSFFNASGDSDAYTGLISFPCDNPYITEVGGTYLETTSTNSSRVSELVWNRGNGTGSGGGISTQYPIPPWQTNINMTACQGSTTMRNVPDVAMIAAGVYVRADGGDYNDVSGTSCAAPLWAGFTALANQQAVATAQPPVGFINPLLSTLASGPGYSSGLYDVTSGDNTSSSSPTNFYAVPGYDLCTGWGTPHGQNLINALAPLFTLAIPANATEGDGVLAGAGQIQLPNTTPTNITITLTSSNTNKVTVPPTVTLLAGQSSVSFDLDIGNGGLLDGTQDAAITAYVPGYGLRSATMQVYDNESATLQLSLPSPVSEGQGTVQGTVYCNPAPDADVSISLYSSNTAVIQVPESVVLPEGQTSTVFTATIVDGDQIAGPQSATVVAHVQNWTDGSATISVLNDISLDLSVALPAIAEKNAGLIANGGMVSIVGTLTTNLPVTLVSSDTNKLLVPVCVSIPAGQLSNTFNLTLVDNFIPDGNEVVSVTADASGFTNGSASILVIDDETPAQPSDPQPADLASNVPPGTNLSWSIGPSGEFIENGGFETGTFTNWYQENSGSGAFVIDDGTYAPPGPDGATAPYAGNYCAVSEQSGSGTLVLYQDLTLPPTASSVTLSWVDRIRNYASDFTSNQCFQVQIRNTNDTVLQTAFTTSPGNTLLNDWTNRTFDLSSYAGQTIRIAFVESDSLNYLNVYLDDISVFVCGAAPGVSNDVYFGTSPTPGPDEFQGNTTNTSWALPLLAPLTTYYWQIVAHKTGTNTGPVWQFTTAGVDHFTWSAIPRRQFTNEPFAVTITAFDALDRVVSNYLGPALLSSTPANTVSPDVTDDFTNGVWTGDVALLDRATNAVLIADDGSGDIGTSNPFNLEPANMAAVVLTQPTDQQAFAWGTANFAVEADGTPCLSYQWYFDDTNAIAGATNSTLTLTNLQSTNAGDYSVIVSNAFGWDSSSNAALDVIPLDHFSWNPIPSPRFVNAPFSVTLVAQDANNETYTTFNGTVLLSGSNNVPVPIQPAISGNFQQGIWTGNITVPQAVSNLVLEASDGAGAIGFASPIDIVNPPQLGVVNQQGGSVLLSWPAEPSGFVLESSDSLSPPNWVPVPGEPTLTNDQYLESFPITDSNQFFLLQYSGP